MGIIRGQEWTFDTVASSYEHLRPGYCEDLYRMVFEYIPIGSSDKVVEVGIGGGQATLPFLQTGCTLTAVEIGEQFTMLCRDKFKDYTNFSVINQKFEDAQFEEDIYDLVYSASAFHWISEEVGYIKVYEMLRSGGVFARFANHPYLDKSNLALSEEIDNIYDKYYNKFYNKKQEQLTKYSEKQAQARAKIADKYGFTDIRYALFNSKRYFSGKEYIALLGTYSDHIAIEESIRIEFFDKIEKAIRKHGNNITIFDTIDLQLARKR